MQAKAQIILDAAKVSAPMAGEDPKQKAAVAECEGFAPKPDAAHTHPTLSSILATQMPCRSRRSGA